MNGIQIEYFNLHNLLEDAKPVPYRALANLKVKIMLSCYIVAIIIITVQSQLGKNLGNSSQQDVAEGLLCLIDNMMENNLSVIRSS